MQAFRQDEYAKNEMYVKKKKKTLADAIWSKGNALTKRLI